MIVYRLNLDAEQTVEILGRILILFQQFELSHFHDTLAFRLMIEDLRQSFWLKFYGPVIC